MEIQVQTQIWEENDRIAIQMAETWKKEGIFCFNLLGSPGAGKTTFLEATLDALKDRYSVAVIEGDLFTAQDAKRIEAKGVPVVQVNTGGGCHLDAAMVQDAVTKLNAPKLDVLIIENVGNLVCPAEFFLGEDSKVTLLSVTEGEDKPLKYPLIFKESAFIGLTKADLLPYLDYDAAKATADLKSLNPNGKIVSISAKNGAGMEIWLSWLEEEIRVKKESVK